MNTKDQYCFKVGTGNDVNEMIQWWNNTLFEYHQVSVYDVKLRCNVEPDHQDRKRVWLFELTTDEFEMCIRRDSYHVKSYWEIHLPQPGYKEN